MKQLRRTPVLLVFLCMTFCVVPVFGLESWNQTYGTDQIEVARWLIQTSDKGYAIGGYTRNVTAEEYDRNFLLVKTDPYGKMEWNQTYELTNFGNVGSFIETCDGGFVIVGESSSVWLIKTDERGQITWNQTYDAGYVAGGRPYTIIETGDGDLVIAGSTHFEADTDVWLIKTDKVGNIKWEKMYLSRGGDSINSVIVTSDGGFALTGSGWSKKSSSFDFWLIKTDENGTVDWNKKYDYNNWWEEAEFVVETEDGGYVIAGKANFPPPVQVYCFWLIKTDSYGNVEWNQTYGETRYENINAIASTLDGGYAMAGYSLKENSENILLTKIDSDGNIEWKQSYGQSKKDIAYSVIETWDGCYAIAGETQSLGNLEPDFFLIKSDKMGNIPEFTSSFILAVFTLVSLTVVVTKKKL